MTKYLIYDTIAMFAGIAQLVERQPSKLNVASSNLVSRSNKDMVTVVQLVERQFVALVVAGSNPVDHPIFCVISSDGRAHDF